MLCTLLANKRVFYIFLAWKPRLIKPLSSTASPSVIHQTHGNVVSHSQILKTLVSEGAPATSPHILLARASHMTTPNLKMKEKCCFIRYSDGSKLHY